MTDIVTGVLASFSATLDPLTTTVSSYVVGWSGCRGSEAAGWGAAATAQSLPAAWRVDCCANEGTAATAATAAGRATRHTAFIRTPSSAEDGGFRGQMMLTDAMVTGRT